MSHWNRPEGSQTMRNYDAISEPEMNTLFWHVSPTPLIDLLISGGYTGGTSTEASGEF